MVAGVLVLLIVLISITGTATYLSLRSFLYDRLDQQVEHQRPAERRRAAAASSAGQNGPSADRAGLRRRTDCGST